MSVLEIKYQKGELITYIKSDNSCFYNMSLIDLYDIQEELEGAISYQEERLKGDK